MATEKGTYYPYDASGLAGNIVRITNAQGVVTGSFEYNAWGENLLNQPPPEGTRFSYSAPAWIELKDDPDGVLVMTPTRAYHRGAGSFLEKDPQTTFKASRESVLNPAQWPVLLQKAMQLDHYVVHQGNSNINVTQAVRNLLSMMWDAELSSRDVSPFFGSAPGNCYAYSGNPIGESDPTGQAFINCEKVIADLQKVEARAAVHFGQNVAYYATHGTIDPGHIKEKKQILGELEKAMQKVFKNCFQQCAKEAYEKAKETLAELEKQISAFADAVDNLDWAAALTAIRNALVAVAILLALALAALPALALA